MVDMDNLRTYGDQRGLVGLSLVVAALLAGGPIGATPLKTPGGAAGMIGQCTVAAMQAAAPADTTITSAKMVTDPVSNCRVEGYVTTNDPTPNRNNFRLQLPDKANWKGRYYFIGMGGSAGYVPTDSQIPAGNPVRQGFAVAGTDTGHQAHLLDWSFLDDPAKAIDHTHRGAHLTAVATQKLALAYYGTDKMYRYHSGCSGGGRMGSEVIQRNPEDYDGVLIGGNDTFRVRKMGMEWAGFPAMVREMTREPGSWLSPAKLQFAENKVTAACDMTDGAKDDLVQDRRQCSFNFRTIQCKGGDKPDCLTKPEVTSIENLLRDTDMPITNLASWTFLGQVPPPWSPEPSAENMPKTSAALVILTTWARAYLGQPDRDIVKNPLTPAELKQMDKVQTKIGFNTPVNPFLKGIEKAGTKVIFWNGVSDSCCSNLGQEEGYRALATTRGNNLAAVEKFAKIYPVPGMAHCGGGTGPVDAPDRLLTALEDWVEKGVEPQAVVTHRGKDRADFAFLTPDSVVSGVVIPPPSGSSRDILICPVPRKAVFDKSKANVPGAVYDAKNWSCQRTT